MADPLERDDASDEQEAERWMDAGVKVLLDEVTAIIADRLGQEDAPEWEMLAALDGVPRCIILEAADRLGVVVWRGAWRVRRRA